MKKMINKLQKFFKLSLLEKYNFVSTIYWKLKSRFWYKLFLGAMGHKSFIISPLMISRPDRIFIGDRVSIKPGARLEVVQSNRMRLPILSIGDGSNLEQNAHIACHNRIVIGKNVSITANCSIVDINHPCTNPDLTKSLANLIVDEPTFVEIGDRVMLGVGTVVLPNVRIGKGAVIGANSVVTHDIPPYAIAAGAPAKVLRIYHTEASQDKSEEKPCE